MFSFMPDSAEAGNVKIERISFIDEVPDEGGIGGTLSLYINGENDSAEIDKYVVELYDYSVEKQGLVELSPNNQDIYTYEVPQNTKVPEGTVFLSAIAYQEGDFSFPVQLDFLDNISGESLPIIELPALVGVGLSDDNSNDEILKPSIGAKKEKTTGWIEGDHKWYYFYNSGNLAANTTINDYRLSSSGAWIQ
jgi:hypothetical protein